jgi:hypothetical protein
LVIPVPVKRRKAKAKAYAITPEVIAAFEAGDYSALHCALHLKPWEASPLPLSVTALGVNQGPPPPWANLHTHSWLKAQKLQREILAAMKR